MVRWKEQKRTSLRRQSVALQHTDHQLLEAIDEINDPQLEGFKKEYGIPEELPRPVIGHVSAPFDGDAVNPLVSEDSIRNQDILLLGSYYERSKRFDIELCRITTQIPPA